MLTNVCLIFGQPILGLVNRYNCSQRVAAVAVCGIWENKLDIKYNLKVTQIYE
jgi:hypothetical protein